MKHIFLQPLTMHGRFNFMQMGREGIYNEQTYRNNFEKDFDYLAFNISLVQRCGSGEVIWAFDPSYLSKSGSKTPELGMFYSGCASRHKKGLEIAGLAVIDMQQHTAYHIEAVQTPAKKKGNDQNRSLVDHYAQVILNRAPSMSKLGKILTVDGYFAKCNFINPICEQTDLTIICRLRDDANLRYLFTGKQKGTGRSRQYGGKVDVSNIDKRRFRLEYRGTDMIIYSAIVNSVSLKRNIKVAYTEFLDDQGRMRTTKLFFSTDIEMSGIDIIRYYKARFQIEYLYRDAKQFTGLQHGQSRSTSKMYSHFNISLTGVSLGKILLRHQVPKVKESVCRYRTFLQN